MRERSKLLWKIIQNHFKIKKLAREYQRNNIEFIKNIIKEIPGNSTTNDINILKVRIANLEFQIKLIEEALIGTTANIDKLIGITESIQASLRQIERRLR